LRKRQVGCKEHQTQSDKKEVGDSKHMYPLDTQTRERIHRQRIERLS
jgi:hypothetical protein